MSGSEVLLGAGKSLREWPDQGVRLHKESFPVCRNGPIMEVVYRQKGGPHNVLLGEGQSRKEWAMGNMEVPGKRAAEHPQGVRRRRKRQSR